MKCRWWRRTATAELLPARNNRGGRLVDVRQSSSVDRSPPPRGIPGRGCLPAVGRLFRCNDYTACKPASPTSEMQARERLFSDGKRNLHAGTPQPGTVHGAGDTPVDTSMRTPYNPIRSKAQRVRITRCGNPHQRG